MPETSEPATAFLTTPDLQRRYAQLVLKHSGQYLRLADPETYAYFVQKATELPMIACHQCGRATVRRDEQGRAYCIGCEERDRGAPAWQWPENREKGADHA